MTTEEERRRRRRGGRRRGRGGRGGGEGGGGRGGRENEEDVSSMFSTHTAQHSTNTIQHSTVTASVKPNKPIIKVPVEATAEVDAAIKCPYPHHSICGVRFGGPMMCV